MNLPLIPNLAPLDLALLGTGLVVLLFILWITRRVVKAAVRAGIRDALHRNEEHEWQQTERQGLTREPTH